jgi:SAM-dependent methyltransferase
MSNLLFDHELLDYSSDCEEPQHYSSHFNAFARRLAKRWVDDYDINEKTILEIGCGQGKFLEIFSGIGSSRGIGIDPACDPARVRGKGDPSLRFISDHFSSKYHELEADVVCCRHTLEHIADTGRFVQDLRSYIGDRRNTLVLFELPDTTRILKERAFWDIYYEHCSYFTAGSLARLFRRNWSTVSRACMRLEDRRDRPEFDAFLDRLEIVLATARKGSGKVALHASR